MEHVKGALSTPTKACPLATLAIQWKYYCHVERSHKKRQRSEIAAAGS